MARSIINIADLEFRKVGHGVNFPGASNAPEKFEGQVGDIGRRLGAQKLGYNLTVVPAGKRAWPFHNHRFNEEMFFILEGEGSIRIAGETHKVRQGDFISLPPGPESAHQIINDSQAPLRYLAVSTMMVPEVVEYPDAGKIGVIAGTSGGRPPGPDSIRHFTYRKDGVDYWEGEA